MRAMTKCCRSTDMQSDKFFKQKATLQSIQMLRVIAVIFIVAFHAETNLSRITGGARITPAIVVPFGTDLLFVISGFLMVYVTARKSLTFTQFLIPRVARLIPLYWLFTSLLVAIALTTPTLLHTTRIDVWHLAASYALVPYSHPVTGLQRPFLIWGWILNLLIPISALYAATLSLPVRKRVYLLSAIILTFVVFNQVTHDRSGLINFYGAPVSLEFLFGLALGAIYLELGNLSPLHASLALVLGFAIFAAGIALHVSDGSNRVWYWGTSSACLLVGIVSIETEFGWFDLGILNGLADASYSTILVSSFRSALRTT